MKEQFSRAEIEFVAGGGNLWYLHHVPDDGWDIVRWSNSGRWTVQHARKSEKVAIERLFATVQPSNFRTRTGVHHQIPRDDAAQRLRFPLIGATET